MTVSLKSLIEEWEGIGVVMRYDRQTGTWIFIALHDDTLGPPTGGTRLKVYPSPALALRDAMRLGAGMTRKWAAVDLHYGGGKAVLAVPRILQGEERVGLLTRYGRLIESLRGTFGTGVDMGTTPDDMLVISQVTSYVHGVDRETGQALDPGPFTARGVFAGILAAVKHAYGSEDMRERVVHVQGVGDVGGPLARMLKEGGAHLVLSDLDTRRAEWRTLHNPVNALVYNADGRSVHMVLVDGVAVVEDGRPTFVDEGTLVDRAQAMAEALLARTGVTPAIRWPLE